MTLVEHVLQNAVFIDFCVEPRMDTQTHALPDPVRFAIVEFQLVSTPLLDQIVDRIRLEAGFAPLHPVDEFPPGSISQDGWYDYFVSLVDWEQAKVGSCIEAVVCNTSAEDEGETYPIDLSPVEQTALYQRLDEQCRTYLGQSCEELLSEARERLKARPHRHRAEPRN